MKSLFGSKVTVVDNEFIDRYMSKANGEYVKVYLYLLRHQNEDVTVTQVADALDRTESDIRRALTYWTNAGVLSADDISDDTVQKEASFDSLSNTRKGQSPVVLAPSNEHRTYTPEQMNILAQQEEFTQLLYIAQKYLNKVFTPTDCEVFAYLYDGLHMQADLLEYLVEYCVQGNHYNIRYLETVALDWHNQGITTVEMARALTSSYNNEINSVMKAFGITDRRAGKGEADTIKTWFKDWGFSKELVLEACDRTLKQIHSPSFDYAGKILYEWKQKNVKTLDDVRRLDEQWEEKHELKKASGDGQSSSSSSAGSSKNQIHTHTERDTDYESVMLDRLNQRLEQ